MDINIHALYLAAVVLVWYMVYHAVYWLVGLARDPGLVCMSVGPLGFSVISLQAPARGRVLAQLLAAALALACAVYTTLFVLVPPPIGGLEQSALTRLTAVAVPVVVLSGLRMLGLWREHRYPLWGEARLLTGVQRGLATGARIYFTATGRAYLRERFGATPHEFLSMVR